MNKCKVKDCKCNEHCRGYCSHHYWLFRKSGKLDDAYNKSIIERVMARVDKKANGCWISNASPNKRYAMMIIDSRKDTRKQISVHRYMLEQKLGRKIKDGYCACHTCDNPKCCNPEHLFEGTQKDNVEDCVIKGRRGDFSGENSSSTNLSNDDVKLIRKLYRTYRHTDNMDYNFLAKEFSVNAVIIGRIIRMETFKNV